MALKVLRMALVLFAVSPVWAQDKDPAGDAERGHQAFVKYQCYTCHGTVGHGADRGTGPRIAPHPFPWMAFQMQVRQPRQDMPAYRKEFLPDQELADIYAYLSSIKPSPDAKEIELLRFQRE